MLPHSPDARGDLKVHTRRLLTPRRQCWAVRPPRLAWSPVCHGGLTSGFTFSLRGIQVCTKQRTENTPDPSPLWEGVSCPHLAACVFGHLSPLGRFWGGSLCRSVRAPRPPGVKATSTPLAPLLGIPGMRSQVCCGAHRQQGRAAWGLLPSFLPVADVKFGGTFPAGRRTRIQTQGGAGGVTCRLDTHQPVGWGHPKSSSRIPPRGTLIAPFRHNLWGFFPVSFSYVF